MYANNSLRYTYLSQESPCEPMGLCHSDTSALALNIYACHQVILFIIRGFATMISFAETDVYRIHRYLSQTQTYLKQRYRTTTLRHRYLDTSLNKVRYYRLHCRNLLHSYLHKPDTTLCSVEKTRALPTNTACVKTQSHAPRLEIYRVEAHHLTINRTMHTFF